MRQLVFLCTMVFLLSCTPNTETQENKNVSNGTKVNPVASGYNVRLGLAYLNQGDVERAKHKLVIAQRQNPQSTDVSGALAYFMEKTGEPKQAEIYYLKAMEQAPLRGGPINNYGAFLCREGHYQKAITYFLKAVDDFQYEHVSGAYENAGLCALQIPDDKQARLFFVKALNQDPARTGALQELVKLDLKSHKPEQALKEIKRYTADIIKDKKLLALAVTAAHAAKNEPLEMYFKVQLLNRSSIQRG